MEDANHGPPTPHRPTVPSTQYRLLNFAVPGPTAWGSQQKLTRESSYGKAMMGQGGCVRNLFSPKENKSSQEMPSCATPRQHDVAPLSLDMTFTSQAPAVPPTPKKSFPAKSVSKGKRARRHLEDSTLDRLTQALRVDESDGSQETAPQGPAALIDGLSQQTISFSQQTSSQVHAPIALQGYHQDFHELQQLGSGSFGIVYAVERRFDLQRFAVKQLVDGACGARDQTRKLLEVRTMGTACLGPHVVQLHHTWIEGSPAVMYILMELCPGGSLQTRARSAAPPSEYESLDILGQLALAVYACHSQNITHSDIKLENIYYDRHGRLKLGDFGLASFLDDLTGQPVSYRQYEQSHNQQHMWTSRENTQEGWMSQDDGDARYIPLDMLNERRHFKAGDMFSLGMCMFELMSGKPLPRGGQAHTDIRCTEAARLVLIQTGRYSPELMHVVTTMLLQDPLQRPTVEQLLHHPLLKEVPAHVVPPRVPLPVAVSLRATVAECEHYRMLMELRGLGNAS